METPNPLQPLGVSPDASADDVHAHRHSAEPSSFDLQGTQAWVRTITSTADPIAYDAEGFQSSSTNRSAARAPLVVERSAHWNALAVLSIAIIVATTIAVLVTTYSGSLAEVSPRLVPAVMLVLVWAAAGHPSRPTFSLLGISMLFWPLAALGVWPLTTIVAASPEWLWALLTASFLATIVLRIAGPRMKWYRSGRPSTA